jgi:hypothetical protein
MVNPELTLLPCETMYIIPNFWKRWQGGLWGKCCYWVGMSLKALLWKMDGDASGCQYQVMCGIYIRSDTCGYQFIASKTILCKYS